MRPNTGKSSEPLSISTFDLHQQFVELSRELRQSVGVWVATVQVHSLSLNETRNMFNTEIVLL